MSEINLTELLDGRECSDSEKAFLAHEIMRRLPDFNKLFHHDSESNEHYETEKWIGDTKITLFVCRSVEDAQTWLGVRCTRMITPDSDEDAIPVFPGEDIYEYFVGMKTLNASVSKEIYLLDDDGEGYYETENRLMTTQDLQSVLLYLEDIPALETNEIT